MVKMGKLYAAIRHEMDCECKIPRLIGIFDSWAEAEVAVLEEWQIEKDFHDLSEYDTIEFSLGERYPFG